MLRNTVKPVTLPKLHEQLMPGMPYEIPENPDVVAVPSQSLCPCCKKGLMQHVMDFDYRGPPMDMIQLLLKQKNNDPLQTTV
jgi:hypothetical protein